MRWSAEQRTADFARDEDTALPTPQELSRCALQLRGDPDVAAVEKGAERIERATVQPNTDRAAELLLIPHCFPAPGQALCPCDSLRCLGESHAIGIPDIETDRAVEFLRVATS